MKIQALVLGKFSLSPYDLFSVYQFPSSTPPDTRPFYFCIEDIDTLFFKNHHFLATKASAFADLFSTSPESFRKDICGRSYLVSGAMIKIARMFNLHVLSVLCTLKEHEILAGIADPLLAIFPYLKNDYAHMPKKTECEWLPSQISGREWFFANPDEERPPSPASSDHSSLVEQAIGRHPQDDETRQLASKHLTSVQGTRPRPFSTPDSRQQQEAIIKTRRFQKELAEGKQPITFSKLHTKRISKKGKVRSLRLNISPPSTVHAGMSAASSPSLSYRTPTKPAVLPITAAFPGPHRGDRSQDKNSPQLPYNYYPSAASPILSTSASITAELPQSRQRLLWPMDRLYDDTPHSCLFKTPFDDQVCLPRLLQKQLISPREHADTAKRRTYDCRDDYTGRNGSLEKHAKMPRLEHCNNLDLLATQATKIRDLPISPEVSPPPPTLLPKLPPIKHMLSELTERLNRLEHKAGSRP